MVQLNQGSEYTLQYPIKVNNVIPVNVDNIVLNIIKNNSIQITFDGTYSVPDVSVNINKDALLIVEGDCISELWATVDGLNLLLDKRPITVVKTYGRQWL